MLEKLALFVAALIVPQLIWAQDLAPPYFNIAEKRKITVNATCGEGVSRKEVYCKLVGYDSFMGASTQRILDGQICDYCHPPDANQTEEISNQAHPAQNAVDGDTTTWWQSPPISRGLKYNRVTLSIDLQQTFQVAYVVVTMANSPRPGVWALERSNDEGETWQPWQFFAGNDAECQKYFGMHANDKITRDDQVICETDFSKVLPIEDGEVYVSLTTGRPSAKRLSSSQTLQDWILATNVRLRLIQTKTMLGHLMSVAQGDKTVTRRYYYSIKEISVGGRCVCNGHAYVCPPSEDSPDQLRCQCQHNTAGSNCAECSDGFTQKKWRPYTKDDPYECEPCNCNGHSDKCQYDPEADTNNLSMDIHGNMEGGGVCDECQHNTEGINCETCIFGFYRPIGVLPNATDPCQLCDCGTDPRYSGNCAPNSGKCECKEEFRGADDCSACADGYYDYPDCKPCDCFANGTVLMENGLPFCVSEGTLQCPCLENFFGSFCDECAEGYFEFPECELCECNSIGSRNDACNRANGQCECKANYGKRQCDKCQDGYFQYPDCENCDCDPLGTVPEICSKSSGKCICKEGFGGPRCDRCEPGWFDYPNCQSCNCSGVGADSSICDPQSGQCPCYNNFGARKCAQCSSGFYSYPDCLACGCDTFGSKGVSCDDSGQCTCKPNFVATKCNACAPARYNYPLCEECNCNPDGVTDDFEAKGGCDGVPEGSLCTCKENVEGRICDTCRPLFWNLQQWKPTGCSDCECHRPGTIGALGICDILDGQCACKANVNTRICEECLDGFYDLSANNGLGCTHCQCDVGGTDLAPGQLAVCDKEDGQCTCRSGIEGRKCDEVQDTFYVPTMHQFQYEIEDGNRKDLSPVRIGHDDAKFPGYSWRGYGTYSQLQDEVLLDVMVTSPSVYNMVLRYSNPNPTPIIGEITMESAGGGSLESGESDGAGTSLAHQVLLPPTGGQPSFVTVSGDKGIYASPFDLSPGQYTTAVKIPNTDTEAEDILVDYFVLVPREYYEPSILKQDVYEPCLAGEILPYCRHYSYPDLAAFPKTYSNNAERPGGGTDVYAWTDNPQILAELGTSKVASLAKWQPELVYPVDLQAPGKHVIAVVFFTPDGISLNGTTELAVSAQDSNGNGAEKSGKAYIFDCKLSTLCRQVVADEEGRVQEFDFASDKASVKLNYMSEDEDAASFGIDSIVAIPLEDWSLDLVTPNSECVRKDGECIRAVFPDAPDESALLPFTGSSSPESSERPKGIIDEDANLLYVDDSNSIVDIHGRVPKPGLYVLVAHYYQPDKPTFDVHMNISYANAGEDPDVKTLLENGQFYEAVLPLPTCRSNSGCRSVVVPKDQVVQPEAKFNLNEAFHISSSNPDGNPVWLESITAIPSDSYADDFLQPEQVENFDFAQKCMRDHFYVNPEDEGYCRGAIISLAADFNYGAIECNCDMQGSTEHNCAKVGGQCPCKDNIIGRQCTRCKPGFFGYPDCKECKCPPTARCNEETGECICAPHVTGTDDNPCSQCDENTFGYDPITGCQECMCNTDGTVSANMSCSLDSGACYCKENVVGRICDHCSAGYYQYPGCLKCPCDLSGATQDICNQDTAECMCKPNVEGENCDSCKEGTFDLEQMNPDGCTNCFCSGKTLFCQSHERLVRTRVQTMEGWDMTSFKITKTVTEQKLRSETLPNYSKELAVSFTSYPTVDMSQATMYFKAPEDFLRNQINSYGGNLNYQLTYSGYELDGAPVSPDVLIVGAGVSLLFHSGIKVRSNEMVNMSVPIDPYYWVLPSGAPIDRPKLMVVLTNLEAIYIKATYGIDADGQARISNVGLDSAVEVPGDRDMTEQDIADQVTSVEQCTCPDGYHGYSCEDCAVGFFRSQEGPLGPICVPCDCNGHAGACHPLSGECVTLAPPDVLILAPDEEVNLCHFRPDLCIVDTDTEHCQDNTTGAHCEKCAEGFFGDATGGSPTDCESCPCPLAENK